jgi:hypothetical protein
LRPLALALLAAVVTLASAAGAQPRRVAPDGCAATHHTLLTLDGDALDPARAPVIAATGEGILVAWRSRSGALRLAPFDGSGRPLRPSRELTAEAGDFALASGGGGAAVLYVERGRELIAARVNARAEAQNVPRVLRREVTSLREVALARSDTGWLALWRDDLQQVGALALDARAVPSADAVALGRGHHLRLRWLPAQGLVALVQDGANGDDPSLVSLDGRAEVTARLRWPAFTLGPFELPDGISAVQMTAAGLPALVRVPPAGASFASSDLAVRARFRLLAAVPEGATAMVVFHDLDAGRTLATRIAVDGASTPAVVRAGPEVPVGVACERGALVVVHRESAPHGGVRIVATRVTCGR